MLSAIIRDIIGSKFERFNQRSKDFALFAVDCHVTDDSIMTLAIAKAIMQSKADGSNLSERAVKYIQQVGRNYLKDGGQYEIIQERIAF